VKIAIVTDIHIGARGDARVFLDHQEKFFMEFFFPYIDENGITTVFDLGDTFDRRKYINYVSLKRGREFFFDQLAKRNIDFHVLVGNHDTYYTNTNDVNSMKLLLKEYPNFKIYESHAEEIQLGSTKFLMLPWISKSNMEYNLNMVSNSNAHVIMGHLEVQGFEMIKGSVCTHGLDMDIFKNFESVYSGHFHHPSRYRNIEYLGAPYEMNWSDYGGSRGFHVFDTETREMKKFENPFKIFHKIDYDDEDMMIDDVANLDTDKYRDGFVKVVIKNRTNSLIYDMFMNRLSESGAADVMAVDDALNLESAGVDDILDETKDTKEILHSYIDSLDTTVNKTKIKNVVDDLYLEALSL